MRDVTVAKQVVKELSKNSKESNGFVFLYSNQRRTCINKLLLFFGEGDFRRRRKNKGFSAHLILILMASLILFFFLVSFYFFFGVFKL